MTIFFRSRYHIINNQTQKFYHAAIATFYKQAAIETLVTADNQPIKLNPQASQERNVLNIISELSARGINDFFITYRLSNPLLKTGLLPTLSVPTEFQPISSSIVHDVCRYLGERLTQTHDNFEGYFAINKPNFTDEFDRDSAMSVVTRIEASGAIELPAINAIVFECKGVYGCLYYGENPSAELLEFMELNIDNGFVIRYKLDPLSYMISHELQKFFTAWKESGYQGNPIPDTAALTFSTPARAVPTRAQNPFVLMPQPSSDAVNAAAQFDDLSVSRKRLRE